MSSEKLEKLKHDQYVAEQKLTAAKHKEKCRPCGTDHDDCHASPVLSGYVRKGRSAAGSHCRTFHSGKIYSSQGSTLSDEQLLRRSGASIST